MGARLLIIISILSAVACSKKTEESVEQTSTTYCSGGTAFFSASATKPSSSILTSRHPRIQLDGGTLQPQGSLGLNQFMLDQKAGAFSITSDSVIPAGTKLVAVVDHECTKISRPKGILFQEP